MDHTIIEIILILDEVTRKRIETTRQRLAFILTG